MTTPLTPFERFRLTIDKKDTDRIPILAVTKMFGIKRIGSNVAACIGTGPDLFVSSQWKCIDEFGHEALWNYSGVFPINEILDPSTVRVTEDDLFVERRYLKSIEEVRSLPDLRVQEQGRIAWLLENIRLLKKISRNRYPVFGWISLPFEAAWMLRGHEIYMDIIESPRLVSQLLEYCLELHLQYARKMVEAGADVIWATNPVVNYECISRRHFESVSFPVDKKFFSEVRKLGVWSMFHACGDWSDREDRVFDLGADLYYLSRYFDLSEVKRKYGHNVGYPTDKI